METVETSSIKQSTNKQFKSEQDNDVIFISENHEEILKKSYENLNLYEHNQKETTARTAFVDITNYDEPIDLTSTHTKTDMVIEKIYNQGGENFTVTNYDHAEYKPCGDETLRISNEINFSSVTPMQYVARPRARRRQMGYREMGFFELTRTQPNFNPMDPQQNEAKQEEVLKAAKSLFSKRTRTLYHWMYPGAPKAQIKSAVASSWESLGQQEKEFYISQVLGRFGFPQCSLMINPQLGGIKELPPLPETEFQPVRNELENAISSISSENIYDISTETSRAIKRKKRQGRPPGSKNKKFSRYMVQNEITQDFQDDPELSKELEQFAKTLNMNSNIHLK